MLVSQKLVKRNNVAIIVAASAVLWSPIVAALFYVF
jgi:hypothetical protein